MSAITIRCVECDLEVTGRLMPDGSVRPSNRERPEPDAKVAPGWCMLHAPIQAAVLSDDRDAIHEALQRGVGRRAADDTARVEQEWGAQPARKAP